MTSFLKLLTFLLGENQKTRFYRAITLIIIISISVMLIINVGCGVKDGKFYFEWKQADVKIDYKKGQ